MTYFVTYPQGQNQRKTKKYQENIQEIKYLYRVFAASFILLISGNKPISIPLMKKMRVDTIIVPILISGSGPTSQLQAQKIDNDLGFTVRP